MLENVWLAEPPESEPSLQYSQCLRQLEGCPMSALTNETLSLFTVKDIRTFVSGQLQIPRHAASNKSLLIDFVLAHGSRPLLSSLETAVQVKLQETEAARLAGAASRKRKRSENQTSHRVARRTELEEEDAHDISKFMKLPTPVEVHDHYREFYDATSNNAVKMEICGVCAREVDVREHKVEKERIQDIPSSARLIPKVLHPAHDLYDGKLLEPQGVHVHGDDTLVNICLNCYKELSSKRNGPPRYALANNLWVGRIPWELQVLTFPEQLLIAHLYPRVYVFKLYPKVRSGRCDPSQLQRGMRGTVSTYELDLSGVQSMLEGRLMPRPSAILASLISVTFIGLGDLPKSWLRTTFRVRRNIVFQALRWLKENNPKYYGDIEISPDRLHCLPEDDIPFELQSIVRQSSDIGVVDQESAGYIPADNDSPGICQTRCFILSLADQTPSHRFSTNGHPAVEY
jgi:hypothetical protein